jgi:hypothetical protein
MVLVRRYAAVALFLLLTMLAGSTATVVLAQATATWTPAPTLASGGGCGSVFNPCGALPWSIPRFPTVALASPTMLPTVPSATPVPITATPTETLTPSPTNTPGGPTPTPSPYWTEVYYDCFEDPCRTELAASVTAQALTLTAVLGSQTPGSINDLSNLAGSFQEMAQTLVAQSTLELDLGGTPSGPAEVADQLGERAGIFFGLVRALQSLDSFTFGVIAFLLLALAFVLIVWFLTTIVPMIFSLVKILINLWQAIKPF